MDESARTSAPFGTFGELEPEQLLVVAQLDEAAAFRPAVHELLVLEDRHGRRDGDVFFQLEPSAPRGRLEKLPETAESDWSPWVTRSITRPTPLQHVALVVTEDGDEIHWQPTQIRRGHSTERATRSAVRCLVPVSSSDRRARHQGAHSPRDARGVGERMIARHFSARTGSE